MWKNRDFTPARTNDENGLRIIPSIPSSLNLNIFKIDKKAEKSCNNYLRAMETSAIEKSGETLRIPCSLVLNRLVRGECDTVWKYFHGKKTNNKCLRGFPSS